MSSKHPPKYGTVTSNENPSLQMCGELNGDVYLCKDVANLTYLKSESIRNWATYVERQDPKHIDRVWNDPEDSRVYKMYTLATHNLKHQTDNNSISFFFGNKIKYKTIGNDVYFG